jgi:hypothetical protein
MALAVLREYYEVAEATPIPGRAPRPAGKVIAFPSGVPLPTPTEDSRTFRSKLAEMEKQLSVDVDRWCAQAEDLVLSFPKSVRQLIPLSPDMSNELGDIDRLIAQYDAGDQARIHIIGRLLASLPDPTPDADGRSQDDILFYGQVITRSVLALERERLARVRFRNVLPALRYEILAARPLVALDILKRASAYHAKFLMNEAFRLSKRVIEMQQLQSGWGEGSGERISEHAVRSALEFINAEPGLLPVLHVYPAQDGGVIFEFEHGKWDLSVEITPLGTVELYGVRTDSDEILEPMHFDDVGPQLMKQIHSRIAAHA